MCSTPRPLVGFIDATFCQPIAHKHKCTPSHWHTHTCTHPYYRWEHSRSVSGMKRWLCLPSQWPPFIHGAQCAPIVVFQSHICGQLIGAMMLCVGRRNTVALGQSPFVCALRDISGSVWVGRKLKRFHSFIVSAGLMSGTGFTPVRLRSHEWRQFSQSFDFYQIVVKNIKPTLYLMNLGLEQYLYLFFWSFSDIIMQFSCLSSFNFQAKKKITLLLYKFYQYSISFISLLQACSWTSALIRTGRFELMKCIR